MFTSSGDDRVLAVDIGGTKTAVALVDRRGRCTTPVSAPTPALAGPATILDAVVDLAAPLLSSAPAPVRAVGVGTAGLVDAASGAIVAANDTIPGWPGTPVRDRLAAALGLPVHVVNDVDAHAAGETWTGAAAGASSALLVAVGTGVGAGLVVGGRPVVGAHGAAGEMGHMPSALAAGLTCPCGRPGHLEAVACGPAVHARYLARGGARDCPTAREVALAAERGDPVARQVLVRAGEALGTALAQVVTVLDPEVVVIGGGLSGSGRLWWDAVEQVLRAELIDPLAALPLRPEALGATAPLVGAARGAWDEVGVDTRAVSMRRGCSADVARGFHEEFG